MSTELKNINRILIINLAFIGDVLLSTPIARALREKYPDAVIDMLVIPVAEGIAKLNPYIQSVYVYDKKGRHRKLREALRMVASLRQNRYDLTVVTNFAMRGAMVARAIGARYRLGYDAQHAGWFLTHAASSKRTEVKHEAENQLAVLQPLGLTTDDTSLVLRISDEDKRTVCSKVHHSPGKPLVLICPAGSYERKSWTIDGYSKLIHELAGEADCCLIGGKAEQALLQQINQNADTKAQVFAGSLSLGELAVLVSMADLLISVDTAPLHIAQAVHTPVIALFGPTNPKTWGPRGEHDIILYHPTDCSPCWGKGLCEERRCMDSIEVAEVVNATKSIIKGRKSE